jgi:AraC-like DNA-binding protein
MIESNAVPDSAFLDVGFTDFEELKQKANIPNMSGVAGKVLDVLLRRVGNDQLNIENIAGDLSLSKRTLQRRLQSENVNFAALRDLVRFNSSIECLLVKNMSIESTSSYLDFSDRTSFTNAFKRWTNLSPSVFRKVYRDYA